MFNIRIRTPYLKFLLLNLIPFPHNSRVFNHLNHLVNILTTTNNHRGQPLQCLQSSIRLPERIKYLGAIPKLNPSFLVNFLKYPQAVAQDTGVLAPSPPYRFL
jgi:hypothetical protein